ncbi:hypothetical protein OLS59_08365, partial [Campylobacter jejuni]|nr:hypothetical protein [Campylobacter jejuni]
LDKSIQDIMLDKELAKLSIDITFFNIIKQLFPFTEFFMSQPDFLKNDFIFYKFKLRKSIMVINYFLVLKHIFLKN